MDKCTILLVGHGGLPSDVSFRLVDELKKLEIERRRRKEPRMGEREAELDRTIRQWPRTPETDPYKYGLEKIAQGLKKQLGDQTLVTAYNEFCAPSVEDAIADLYQKGVRNITIVCTMFTPGGSHSEIEIPEIVEQARKDHPDLALYYAWPFDENQVGEFLASHLSHFDRSKKTETLPGG